MKRELLQIREALDTAAGVIQLVEAHIRPSDLPACREEIDAAKVVLDALLEARGVA